MIAAFAAVYFIWGSTYLGIRYAIETLPPFLMAGTRFLVAGSIAYGWSRAHGAPRPTRAQWQSAAVVGGLMLLGGNGLVTWAEQRVSSSLTALLIGSTPLWIALVGWVGFGTSRPTGRMASGLFGGLVGVALLIGPSELLGGGQVDPLGALALALAQLCWAIGSLYTRRARLPRAPLLATGMEMLAGSALLFAAGTLSGNWGRLDLGQVSLKSVLALVYLTLFGSLIGFSAYIWLLKHTTPARAASHAYVNPVVALILGWALADEELSVRTLLAAAIIIASVVLITAQPAQGESGERVPQPEPAAEAAARLDARQQAGD
jgi:drug/metabolite transporter (DMT)-like permease